MEEYPEELRTPPVALVALVGVPEIHPTISMFLHKEQPPINTLALPDFTKLAVICGKERRPPDARLPPPPGIWKADWLLKHRTRIPAVLAVLFNREQVNGDPSQWLEVCTHLDDAKNSIKGRNTRLVILVVQPGLNGDINEDRMTALRKRAEVDMRNCVTFVSQDPNELKRSLGRLGSIMGELANVYYREEGRRVKLRIDKKNYNALELSVRYNFKMAVYAEFRRDWVAALRCYENAYNILQEVAKVPVEFQQVQRIVELKVVAEQLHFKIVMLLMHSGKEAEAVKWFRQHVTCYKPSVGPPEGAFLHWAWVSKQFHVFADLLKASNPTSSAPSTSVPLLSEVLVTDTELRPGYYYQMAAVYVSERRQAFEMALATFEAFEDVEAMDTLASEDIVPPVYVGQPPQIIRQGNPLDLQSPTHAEYMRHAILEEKKFPHTLKAIDLLKKAHDEYKIINASRTIYYIGSELGREYFTARDYTNAKQLFDTVAGLYRKEAWVALLGASLGHLRECARQLGLLKEYVEYTLELATLPEPTGNSNIISDSAVGPAGPLGSIQRLQLHREIISVLQGAQTVLPARESEDGLAVTASHQVALQVDLVSPLKGVLSVCVGFVEQTAKPGKAVGLCISLLTHLPCPLVINKLEIKFNQSSCNFIIYHTKLSESANMEFAHSFDLELQPQKWKRLSTEVVAVQSGKLECLSAVAHLGPYSTICCQVESFASTEPFLLWLYEPGFEASPVNDINLAVSGQRAIQVEEPEALVDVDIINFGTALVGELFPIGIVISSRGHAIHSAELLISADLSEGHETSLSLLSLTTPGPSPVDLMMLGGSATSSKDFIDGNVDLIASEILQKLAGSVQVPLIETHGKSAILLFARWSEAKSVFLSTSLNYQIELDEQAGPGILDGRYCLQKRIKLDCEEAFDVTHRYMGSFRRDALLPSTLAEDPTSKSSTSVVLPSNEMSILTIDIKNASSLPINLLSLRVEETGTVMRVDSNLSTALQKQASNYKEEENSVCCTLLPEESFTHLLRICPPLASAPLKLGTAVLRWQRDPKGDLLKKVCDSIQSNAADLTTILLQKGGEKFLENISRHVPLPSVTVEESPLVISLHSPPYGLLGAPFRYDIKVHNHTTVRQEVKFSLVDAQSFLLTGASRDATSILPLSTEIISLKLVPIACGMQQLPQVAITSLQYSATYHPAPSNTHLFVFPTAPHLEAPIESEFLSSSRSQ